MRQGSERRKPINRRTADHRPKGLNFLVIALVIIMVALLCYVAFRSRNSGDLGQNDGSIAVSFYFINAATNKLESEIRNIPNGERTEILSQTLVEWIAGPKSDLLSATIPPYVSIEGVKYDDVTNTVEITFSESYNDMSDTESAICNASLVYTLTSLDFISGVHFYIGDAELLKSNGQPIGVLNQDNVVLDMPGQDEFDLKTVRLYFSDTQGMGLMSEEREIKVSPTQPLEKYVIEELIKGPEADTHFAVISPDIKLRSVKTEEGLCYVDFTADFVKKFEGGSTAENLLIYSIVDSLTELSHIKKVQILVEGDRISGDQGFSMDLSKPIERNENILLN